MDVIEILRGHEDWQRIAEMIQSIAKRELDETPENVAQQVDEKRGGGTRKSRRS